MDEVEQRACEQAHHPQPAGLLHVRSLVARFEPEDQLHQAQNGDLLPELVHVLCQSRLVVQHRLMLGAKLIVSVQIASMETLQHLLQPPVVLDTIQNLNLHTMQQPFDASAMLL